MPNYCYNNINVSGEAKELKKFDEQFRKPYEMYTSGYETTIELGKEEEICNFNKEDIKNIKIKITKSNYNDNSLSLQVAMNKEVLEQYTFNNFIDLGDMPSLDEATREWGTKWDLFDFNKDALIDQIDNINKIVEKENERDEIGD